MAKPVLCFEMSNAAFPIRLSQTGFDQFTVQYGKSVKAGLTYAAAAADLGEAIMHCLACDGKLDNRSKAEGRAAGDRRPYFSDPLVDAAIISGHLVIVKVP